MDPSRLARTAREVLLTAGAVLGVACILLTVAGFAFGLKPLVFRSGSMSPAIETGDLGFARSVPAAELETGDIVSVTNAAGERITHRLVDFAEQDGLQDGEQGDQRQLTLKGDANDDADAEVYTVRTVDRVAFHVPKAGYLVGWLSGPLGVFLLGAYAFFLLSVVIRGRPAPRGERPEPDQSEPDEVEPDEAVAYDDQAARSRRGPRTGGAGMAALVLVGVLTGGVAAETTSPTSAAFTDDVAITGSTLTAGVVAAPATFTCTVTGTRQIRFDWSAVSGATSYLFHYGASGATTNERTTTTVTLSASSGTSTGTAWVEARRNFGSVTWTSDASTNRTYRLAASSSCS